jgi:hypothetical protein
MSFDLLKDQEFPTVTANGSGQDRKLVLLEWLAVKQRTGPPRQRRGTGRQHHCRSDQKEPPEVGSPHKRGLQIGEQRPVVPNIWWWNQWLMDLMDVVASLLQLLMVPVAAIQGQADGVR